MAGPEDMANGPSTTPEDHATINNSPLPSLRASLATEGDCKPRKSILKKPNQPSPTKTVAFREAPASDIVTGEPFAQSTMTTKEYRAWWHEEHKRTGSRQERTPEQRRRRKDRDRRRRRQLQLAEWRVVVHRFAATWTEEQRERDRQERDPRRVEWRRIIEEFARQHGR